MPAQVIIEYRTTMTESVNGRNAPVKTFSGPGEQEEKQQRGPHVHSLRVAEGSLPPPHSDCPLIFWNHSKVIFHGFTNIQTLPSSAAM